MRGTLHCMLSPPPKSQKPGGVRLSPGLWGLQLCVLQEALLDQYTHRGESLLCVPGGERDTEKDTSRDTETERDKQPWGGTTWPYSHLPSKHQRVAHGAPQKTLCPGLPTAASPG